MSYGSRATQAKPEARPSWSEQLSRPLFCGWPQARLCAMFDFHMEIFFWGARNWPRTGARSGASKLVRAGGV